MKVNTKININFRFFLPQSFQTCFCFLGDRLWSYNTNSCRTFSTSFFCCLNITHTNNTTMAHLFNIIKLEKFESFVRKQEILTRKNVFKNFFFRGMVYTLQLVIIRNLQEKMCLKPILDPY